MFLRTCIITFFVLLTVHSELISSQYIRGGFSINNDEYTLRWEVQFDVIIFKAIAKGRGYVGFGISPKGTMEGSDLFVAGMYENGTIYSVDAHGGAEKDVLNNYVVMFLTQGAQYTEVHFRRQLHTGDCKEDISIVNEPQYIIWAIGPDTDALEHHGPKNRGAVLVNLLNPPMFHSSYVTDPMMKQEQNRMCLDNNMKPSMISGDEKTK